MAPTQSNSIHRSSSRPQLDLSKAEIQGNVEEKYPTILLPNQSDDISHLALDIGGSLIKLVYFSRHEDQSTNDKRMRNAKDRLGFPNGNRRSYPILGGRLHFVKFETSKINECLDFIYSKQLHCGGWESHNSDAVADQNPIIKATGGGAFKFADLFKERLGLSLEKEDEMDCLVAGANFLLKAIRHEAFTHMEGQKQFVQIDPNDLFPYLLINIGSGVSMIKVDGDGKFERVSGTNVGGGTYWGLGRLLTKCQSFDELLELSQKGDNRNTDMLVGDIYGGMDYSKIGLSASTIASSFGKATSEKMELEDYRPEDISLSLLRMISYNIAQISYLNALRFGLKRIFFGGFFIRGHAYTMDAISFAINFWSKGAAQAMFLRHEGFLGALGAFMSYEKHVFDDLMVHQLVERFPMGAPYTGGNIYGPPLRDLNEKISWMEKFLQKVTEITAPVPMAPPGTNGPGDLEVPLLKGSALRSDASALNVGVLHLVPTLEVFPLLADPKMYEPNTIDLSDHSEFEYWFKILTEHLSDLVDKAVASEGGTDDAKKRGDGFARAFSAHLARLKEEPAAYGKLGLAKLLEMREECLREFHFADAYKSIKQRENEASLAVLPDLLMELDSLDEETRLLTLIEGVLAANIFDWGSRACVDLYHQGTIIEIYRMSRNKMQRPWRVDEFDAFKERMLGTGNKKLPPHRRALLFVDNSGADIVLGMLPLARELLRGGTEVVLVANSLPALNDVTAVELPDIVAEAAKHCDILRRAAESGGLLVDAMANNTLNGSKENSPSVPLMVVENGCGGPCIDLRQVSSELAAVAKDADLIILEGMGRALHTNLNARFQCDALKISYLNALRFGLKRIFFGGFFIRGHAYTMDAISFAINFWSKGAAQAMFLRHEGFLGALGAFMSYEKHVFDDLMVHQLVERFPMGAPYTGGNIYGPPLRDLNEKISWMEKFLQKVTEITAPVPMAPPGTNGPGDLEVPLSKGSALRSDASALNVGVLHLVPTLEVFPLLADPKMYEPNTIDLSDHSEFEYWFKILTEHLSDLVDKAVASEGGTDDAKKRGDGFARAFSAHLARLKEEPGAYGKLGLAKLLEMREECLREFHFVDAYKSIKQRENEASLAVLPDLLMELDSLDEETRLLTLIEGVLAANIFDWGSRACVDLYHQGTIIEIYRMSRNKMQRPWRVDEFDAFKERMLGTGNKKLPPHRRALLFVDNSGADIVLGMLPLARELLRGGTEVVLVANSLPALNDVTAVELPDIVAEAAKHCDILRRAAESGGLLVDAMANNTLNGSKENSPFVPLMVVENGCGGPCIDLRQVNSELAAVAKDADLIILEGMGRALHTNLNARFQCDALKLAIVKNQRLAEKLVKGNIYDSVCKYEPANRKLLCTSL